MYVCTWNLLMFFYHVLYVHTYMRMCMHIYINISTMYIHAYAYVQHYYLGLLLCLYCICTHYLGSITSDATLAYWWASEQFILSTAIALSYWICTYCSFLNCQTIVETAWNLFIYILLRASMHVQAPSNRACALWKKDHVHIYIYKYISQISIYMTSVGLTALAKYLCMVFIIGGNLQYTHLSLYIYLVMLR